MFKGWSCSRKRCSASPDTCCWRSEAGFTPKTHVMVGMGYNLEGIQESLAKMKYDEITATYLLLGRKASELEPSESASSSNLSLAKPRPNSELNGQSPSHLKNVPPGMAHPKRSQTTTAENSAKEEGGVQLRKPGTPGAAEERRPPAPCWATPTTPTRPTSPTAGKAPPPAPV
ncbi:hypothetical protein INR49_002888 [Caranx melampygus]|nr:hypothetical protein INR49_002888 [Caranx melampygus]